MGMELSEFDIKYMSHKAIKGQVITNFVAEFNTPLQVREVEP